MLDWMRTNELQPKSNKMEVLLMAPQLNLNESFIIYTGLGLQLQLHTPGVLLTPLIDCTSPTYWMITHLLVRVSTDPLIFDEEPRLIQNNAPQITSVLLSNVK